MGSETREGKHTPGPWELGKNGVDCAENHAICAGPTVIARVYGTGYPVGKGWSARSEADARRIVHCVNCHDELVEALEEMLRWNDFSGSHPAGDKALAAVAKARGAL